MVRRVGAWLLVAVLAAGCVMPESTDAEADPCPVDRSGSRTVNAACVDPWPLTVDEAVVECEMVGGEEAPLLVVDGTTYGLTGLAATQVAGAEQLDDTVDVWAEDEVTLGRVSIRALADAALEMC